MLYVRIYLRLLLILTVFLVVACKPDTKKAKDTASEETKNPTFLKLSDDPNLLTPYNPDTIKRDMIRIGLLLSQHPEGKDISLSAWHGAELAVSEINDDAGLNGKRIMLIVRSCDGPWGMGSTQAVNMAYKDSVIALVASADGRNSHLIEQVVAKTHTPVVSAWATEPTLTEAFVPWFFRMIPNDRQQAEVLINEIYGNEKSNHVGLISFGDYDSRQAARAFYRLTEKHHYKMPDTLDFKFMNKNIDNLAGHLIDSRDLSVVFTGHPHEAIQIIREILRRSRNLKFYGNSWMASSDSLLYSQGQRIPLEIISPGFLDNGKGKEFIKNYRNTFGYDPDAAAAYAYDGINLLFEAINKSSIGHDALRDIIHAIHYNGICGKIAFDDHGNLTTGATLMKCYSVQ